MPNPTYQSQQTQKVIAHIANTAGVFPAYHMNKQNWITIILDDTLSDAEIYSLIDRSFQLASTK